MKALSVYIHIPFCVQKCMYCDFLSWAAGEEKQEEYGKALLREIERESGRFEGYEVKTVFVGGGTPSVMDPGIMEEILERVRESFKLDRKKKTEITMEVNPGTVHRGQLERYRRAGVNRLSIGLQSADEAELKVLGRIHSWNDFYMTYEAARTSGLTNVNVDVMSGLPGQGIDSFQRTLEKVIGLRPEHVSVYGLMIEEGTPFYERFGPGREAEHELPAEEEDRTMYAMTGTMLKEQGYRHYEISNYALPEQECRHNIVYWRRGDYLGLGLGAASMISNVRRSNAKDMRAYIVKNSEPVSQADTNEFAAAPLSDSCAPGDGGAEPEQILTIREQMEEFMFLGLRMIDGVECRDFFRFFHRSVEDVYGEVLNKLIREGLILKDENIRLTPYGRDISNYVMAQFLFE